jgi:hypothetical protein
MMRGLVVAVVVLALGCRPAPDVARTDLRAYLERSQGWAPVEAETARTIERILKTHFVDEAEIHREIADSRPRILAHLERLRAYTPRSEEVGNVHGRYVAAWQTLLGGFDAIEDGFASGDYTKLARGREAMAGWRDGIVGVAQELRQLMQHYGIEAPATIQS